MTVKRKVHSAVFKGRVALEALKGMKPIPALASQFEVHPAQISQWKKQLKEGVSEIFNKKRGQQKDETKMIESQLFEEIGRLKMELSWLKKKIAPFS